MERDIAKEALGYSLSGFYDDLRGHAKPAVDAQPVAIVARLKAIALQTRHRDGSRRMARQRQAEEFHVGHTKAWQLMKEAGATAPNRRGAIATDSGIGDFTL